MFFSEPKKKELTVGEVIIVGSTDLTSGKFVAITRATAKIESIQNLDGCVQINLDWGPGFSKSKVFAHDEGKVWVRAANFN